MLPRYTVAPPKNCGFETFIETGTDIKVGALYNGTVVWLASVSFEPLNVCKRSMNPTFKVTT